MRDQLKTTISNSLAWPMEYDMIRGKTNDYRCFVGPNIGGNESRDDKNIVLGDFRPPRSSLRSRLDVGSSPEGSPKGADHLRR